MKVEREGGLGCEGGGGKKKRNMTEPEALRGRMCREHLCHHLPFRLFSTEGKKESI